MNTPHEFRPIGDMQVRCADCGEQRGHDLHRSASERAADAAFKGYGVPVTRCITVSWAGLEDIIARALSGTSAHETKPKRDAEYCDYPDC